MMSLTGKKKEKEKHTSLGRRKSNRDHRDGDDLRAGSDIEKAEEEVVDNRYRSSPGRNHTADDVAAEVEEGIHPCTLAEGTLRRAVVVAVEGKEIQTLSVTIKIEIEIEN